MTALIRSWTFSWNNVPSSQASRDAQGKAVLLAWKTGLLAAGCTVVGSSNGVAGGMDAVDRWSATTDIVWAAAGVAHSWIVMKSKASHIPGGGFTYFTIACSTGATNQHLINTNWSSAIPTAGSSTADPTQTLNWSHANKQFLSTTLANSKYHFHYNTLGDWLFFTSRDASVRAQFAAGSLAAGTDAESGDNFPWIGFDSFIDSGSGGFRADLTIGNSAAIFWITGAKATGEAGVSILYLGGGATTLMVTMDVNGSDISTKYPDYPAVLCSIGSGQVAFRGTLVDVALAPAAASIVQATVEPPLPAAPTHAIVGDFWVPCGGVVPTF